MSLVWIRFGVAVRVPPPDVRDGREESHRVGFGRGDELATQLRSAGVEILLEPEVDDSGNAWAHFRAPDGNIYEFTQDPGVSRPH
jgi:catechol 2,3-dioxygenase-like lactoylglutathione lyase family enzyme